MFVWCQYRSRFIKSHAAIQSANAIFNQRIFKSESYFPGTHAQPENAPLSEHPAAAFSTILVYLRGSCGQLGGDNCVAGSPNSWLPGEEGLHQQRDRQLGRVQHQQRQRQQRRQHRQGDPRAEQKTQIPR